MSYQTPQFAFVGGPLDGQRIAKTIPGRHPFGLDAEGRKMRTDTFWRRIANGPSDVYMIDDTGWEAGVKIFTYKWMGGAK